MSGISTSQRLASAGFTLIETLIVVTILALAAAVAMPLTRPSDRMRLEALNRDVIGALRLTRAAALTRNTTLVLIIDVDRRTFESPVVSRRSFASDVSVQMKIAEPERETPSRGGFRFFPDGSSTGGDLTLALHGQETKICVNWLTGEARQRRGC